MFQWALVVVTHETRAEDNRLGSVGSGTVHESQHGSSRGLVAPTIRFCPTRAGHPSRDMDHAQQWSLEEPLLTHSDCIEPSCP